MQEEEEEEEREVRRAPLRTRYRSAPPYGITAVSIFLIITSREERPHGQTENLINYGGTSRFRGTERNGGGEREGERERELVAPGKTRVSSSWIAKVPARSLRVPAFTF